MADVACTCEGAVCIEPCQLLPVWRTYVCTGCGREVPWCFGANDYMPDHCDDCWLAAHTRGGV